MPGLTTIKDEEDLIAKSFAADIQAAVKDKNIDLIAQYLQSAVDFSAIKSAYQENYGKDVGKEIQQAFNKKEEQITVITFLLKQTKLLTDNTKTSEVGSAS